MAKSADAFRTISEVADWLETPAHVLRFWESKFSQVKPVKRAGGRRYYRPADMELLGGIKKLLHDDGMTIKGVQKILREQGVKHVSALSQPLEPGLEAYIDATSLDVTPDEDWAETAQIVDFQPAAQTGNTAISKAQPPEAVPSAPDISDTDVAADGQAEDQTDNHEDAPDVTPSDDSPRAKDIAEEARQETETAPVLPSFSHRRAIEDAAKPTESESEQNDSLPPVAEPEAAPGKIAQEPPAPPNPKPAVVSVPEDPTDDMEAQAGLLSLLASLSGPIGADKRHRIETLMERLRQIADRPANGPKG